MMNGTGINGVYPALAGADSLINDIPEMLTWILDGGEVNGVSHSFSLTNREVSDLMNYIRNSWGNEGEAILPEEVEAALQESLEDD
jgi:mono/diheme cytochrome c family protein